MASGPASAQSQERRAPPLPPRDEYHGNIPNASRRASLTTSQSSLLLEEGLESLNRFLLSSTGNLDNNNNHQQRRRPSRTDSIASLEEDGIEDLQRDLQLADQQFRLRRRSSAGASSLGSSLSLSSFVVPEEGEDEKEEEEETTLGGNKKDDHIKDSPTVSSSVDSVSSSDSSGDLMVSSPLPKIPSSPSQSVNSNDTPFLRDPEFTNELEETTRRTTKQLLPKQQPSEEFSSWRTRTLALVVITIICTSGGLWINSPTVVNNGNPAVGQQDTHDSPTPRNSEEKSSTVSTSTSFLNFVSSFTTCYMEDASASCFMEQEEETVPQRRRRGRYRRNSRMLVVDRRREN